MGKRVNLAIENAFMLFLVGSVVGGLDLRILEHQRPGSLLLAITIPALSAIALICLSAVLPGLVPEDKLAYPQNLTMPVVNCALMVAITEVLLTTRSAIEAPGDRLRIIEVWLNPLILSATVALQIGLLSFALYAAKRKAYR